MLNLFCPTCGKMVNVEPVEQPTDACLAYCPTCNTALRGQRHIEPHTRINRYEIVGEIGRGGMGVVYLAHQLDLDRMVALKVLSDEMASDEHFRDAFFNEAKAAAALDHPNIVQAIESGKAPQGLCYFVMELIDGENLDVYVQKNGAMPLDMALKCAMQITDALNYAWEFKRIAHRDIKPENIIYLPKTDTFKLADFGLAKDFRNPSATDQNDDIMATPAYAPPEVIRGEKINDVFKSDMYSFGASLYHIIAGNPPFSGKTPEEICEKQQNEQPKPLIGVNSNIPSELSMLVDNLMEKAPAKRPESWLLVLDKLNAIAEERYENANAPAADEKDNDATPRANERQRKMILYVLLAFSILFFLVSLSILIVVLTKPVAKEQPIKEEQTEQRVEEDQPAEQDPEEKEAQNPQDMSLGQDAPVPDETQNPSVKQEENQVIVRDPWDELKEKIKPYEARRTPRDAYHIWQNLVAYRTRVGDGVNPEFNTLYLSIQNKEYATFCNQQKKDKEYIDANSTRKNLEQMNEEELIKLQAFIRRFVRNAYLFADWTPAQCPISTLEDYTGLANKEIQARINILRKEAMQKAMHEKEMQRTKPLEFKAVADMALHGSTPAFDRVSKAWLEKYQQYVTDGDREKINILRSFSENLNETLFDVFVQAFQRDVFKGKTPFPTIYGGNTIRGVYEDGKKLRMIHREAGGLSRVLNIGADDWIGKDKMLLEDFIFKSGLFKLLFLQEQKKLLHRAAAQGITIGDLKRYVEDNLNISADEFSELFKTLDEMRRLGILR